MKPPTERQAAPEIADQIAAIFETPEKIRLEHVGAGQGVDAGYDYAISAGGYEFLGEYKSSATAGVIKGAIQGLKRIEEESRVQGIPVIIVPYMGEVGRELCEGAGVSWIDLSGNAKVVGPGLRIRIEGRPNRYVERGRPPNIFAPKSSRITRQLLSDPLEFQTQSELARRTGLNDGYVSKIVRRLIAEEYVDVHQTGGIRPRDPGLLLDAWREAFQFDRQRILRGHVTARSGEELLQRVAKTCHSEKLNYAVTGLSAAWLYSHFAAFRLVTVYLEAMPTRHFLNELEYSDEPKGANLWFVLPDDAGVFHESREPEGIRCVSPLQTYLDLKGHPERAKEAEEELRRRYLHWRVDGT